MVKAVANSPHIYNRNVSYATNTALTQRWCFLMKVHISMHCLAVKLMKIEKRISALFRLKKPSPRCPVLLKTIGDYNLMTCMSLHYY